MAHVPSRKAGALLGLHPNTLRSYANKGQIPYYRNSAGQRLYDVDAYLKGNQEPETVCYCRVSSHKQKDDLQRQVDFMRELYPDATVVSDSGPALKPPTGSPACSSWASTIPASPGASGTCPRICCAG